MIQIVIADDHPIVREGLKRIIAECPDMYLVGEADNGDAAIEQCGNKNVDVLLLDISMPGPGFLETLQSINARYKSIKVLVLSIHPEEQYAISAIEAGAAGYLSKNNTPDQLANAIRHVYAGNIYMSPKMEQELNRKLESGEDQV